MGEKHPVHYSESVRTILIGLKSSPRLLAVNEMAGTVYLICNDSILVIDGSTDSIIDSITDSPKHFVLNSETSKAYAVLKKGIAVIDTISNEVSDRLFEEYEFGQVCVNQSKDIIYAVNHSSGTIYVIGGASQELVTQIKSIKNPTSLTLNPKDNKLFVACENNIAINVIDCATNSIIENIIIPAPVSSLNDSCETYVNQRNNMVYVLLRSILQDGNGSGHEVDSLFILDDNTKNLVKAINPRTGLKAQFFLTDDGHESFAINDNSGHIYLTNVSKKLLHIMNPQGEVIHDLPISKSCAHIAINSGKMKLYLANSGFFKKSLEIKYLN
jgi:DNA-binding beta-propeller fold protein YncE